MWVAREATALSGECAPGWGQCSAPATCTTWAQPARRTPLGAQSSSSRPGAVGSSVSIESRATSGQRTPEPPAPGTQAGTLGVTGWRGRGGARAVWTARLAAAMHDARCAAQRTLSAHHAVERHVRVALVPQLDVTSLVCKGARRPRGGSHRRFTALPRPCLRASARAAHAMGAVAQSGFCARACCQPPSRPTE